MPLSSQRNRNIAEIIYQIGLCAIKSLSRKLQLLRTGVLSCSTSLQVDDTLAYPMISPCLLQGNMPKIRTILGYDPWCSMASCMYS